jgi:hypothetical protein
MACSLLSVFNQIYSERKEKKRAERSKNLNLVKKASIKLRLRKEWFLKS